MVASSTSSFCLRAFWGFFSRHLSFTSCNIEFIESRNSFERYIYDVQKIVKFFIMVVVDKEKHIPSESTPLYNYLNVQVKN